MLTKSSEPLEPIPPQCFMFTPRNTLVRFQQTLVTPGPTHLPKALTKTRTEATRAAKGSRQRKRGSFTVEVEKPFDTCHGSTAPSREMASAQLLFWRDIFPPHPTSERIKDGVNHMGHMLQIRWVWTSTDQRHKSCNVVDHPNSSTDHEMLLDERSTHRKP